MGAEFSQKITLSCVLGLQLDSGGGKVDLFHLNLMYATINLVIFLTFFEEIS